MEGMGTLAHSNAGLLQWKLGLKCDLSWKLIRMPSMCDFLFPTWSMKTESILAFGIRYAETLEINMSELKEPVLCAPNDPDDARLLSEVAGTKIDEVFIGSCMTNIGHFRAAGKLLDRHDVSGA